MSQDTLIKGLEREVISASKLPIDTTVSLSDHIRVQSDIIASRYAHLTPNAYMFIKRTMAQLLGLNVTG